MPTHPAIEGVVREIQAAPSILVASHINPDGDTLGSALGLALGMEILGKEVQLVSPDGVPLTLRALPGWERFQTEPQGEVALAIAVDCGSWSQLGPLRPFLEKVPRLVQLDHHGEGQPFGHLSYLDHRAAATGEMVFDLLRALNVKMTPPIAIPLLMAIITDTGSFRYPSTRHRTFQIVEELLATAEVEYRDLIEALYWHLPPEAVKLQGLAMARIQLEAGGQLAWTYLTQEDVQAVGGDMAMVDDLPNEMRTIEGVQVAVLFRELPDGRWRVSLRSREPFEVASIAQRFQGGGHPLAAGCRLGSRQDWTALLEAVKENLKAHSSFNPSTR